MSIDQEYFQSYDQYQVHELMLRDRPRVAAYYDAMMNNKHLFENKIVLDVGSGTGILSMFAAKAGAKKVYAVDACPTICDLAQELIKSNGLQDRIEIINKRLENIDKFNDDIDIIISEWMGFYLFHESMLESVIYARDHFLRKTTSEDQSPIIFPSHAYLYCAPFFDQTIRFQLNDMWTNYFDLNFSSITKYIKNSDLSECVIETIEPSQLVHDAHMVQSINLQTIEIDDIRTMRSYCEFHIDNTCIISGFCFWFDCYFSSKYNSNDKPLTRLTTSPHSSKTHWKQTLVFLPEDIYPLKDNIIPVNIKLKQSSDNRRHYDLTISVDEMKENCSNDETDTTVNTKKRRSSTVSSGEHIETNSSSDSETDDDEHPIPCSCERPKCKLIRTIMDQYREEESIE